MKRFDVWANIVAGLLIWVTLTGLMFFFLSWGSDDPLARRPPLWPRAVLVIASIATFSLYAKKYWKKLER